MLLLLSSCRSKSIEPALCLAASFLHISLEDLADYGRRTTERNIAPVHVISVVDISVG